MKALLDALSFEEKASSLLVAGLSIITLRLLTYLKGALISEESTLPLPIVLVVNGKPCTRKEKIIEELRGRFIHNSRPFLKVSLNDLTDMLLPEQLVEAFSVKKACSVFSERGSRYLTGLHSSWSNLVLTGNNLIIDHYISSEAIALSLVKGMGHALSKSVVVVNVDNHTEFSSLNPLLEPLYMRPQLVSLSMLPGNQQLTISSDHQYPCDLIVKRLAELCLL